MFRDRKLPQRLVASPQMIARRAPRNHALVRCWRTNGYRRNGQRIVKGPVLSVTV